MEEKNMDPERLYELVKEGKTGEEVVEILQQEARENDKIFGGDIMAGMMAAIIGLLVVASMLK